jgi:hypothetical protein
MHYKSKLKARHGSAPRRQLQSVGPRKVKQQRGALHRARRRTGHCIVDPSRVFQDLLPDLAENGSGFGWACCPFHDDGRPSFCVNTQTGWYRCASTSCGATGSNIVSFVGALLGLSFADARSHLEARYA